MNRHDHSVLEVCGTLIGWLSGSGDSISFDSVCHLCAWLCWRVEAGWEPGPLEMVLVDDGVREMARRVAYKAGVRIVAQEEARSPVTG
jgi:hypothetical protein